jgi:acyl-CoA synthetase (AMP-forming)/AMP-acid ligase II
MTTVAELLARRARETPARTYLESARDDRIVSWELADTAARRWVERLDTAGIPAGARVSLRVADPLRFAVAFLGILVSGRMVAPTAPEPSPADLARHLRTVAPAAVVHPAPTARAAGQPDLLDDLGGAWAAVDVADPQARAARSGAGGGGGLMLASSGTTGPPKLVALSEEQLLHTAASIAGHHGFTPADRGFNPLTLFHINAEVVGVLTALVAGSQLVLDDRFHRTGFWKLLADREVTWLNGVPAILAILAQNAPEPAPPRSLRFARSASAPLPVATLRAFELMTGIGVVETYGMTEAGSQITANPVDGSRRPGSVGLPVGVELQVVDPVGAELPAGSIGRVRIRGAGVITRYATEIGNERLSADGWLDTGDLGHVDPDGFLYLAGRDDDVINRGGEKFFPGDIEEILTEDPGVAAVVVVGWPDPVLGSVPVAAIVLVDRSTTEDAAAAVDRLAALAAERLDRPRRPVRFHIVEGLPSGVNGKISRRAVREQLRGRFGDHPAGSGDPRP